MYNAFLTSIATFIRGDADGDGDMLGEMDGVGVAVGATTFATHRCDVEIVPTASTA
jgi:hypothetical protein